MGDGGAISHWDGAGWTQIQYGQFPYYPFLTKVHGSSADDVWVAGRASTGTNAPVILHNVKDGTSNQMVGLTVAVIAALAVGWAWTGAVLYVPGPLGQ